ncbi:Serine/threonine protein kinase [Flexibacter flexilis DSM 6793]|uniref:non-specific serine/threonine protein kinase n=1 Tax=Flexibacter flexilis DSM 6793 TaxID=927664 RepID=A0A1I1DUT1_9BACT|nr:serine/threonine-protein kinase [Flexibacter flexilis]SFB78162.1 Serine/threonine protein kinase [Flexibacter flexilis DSM 6793]
MIGSQIAHYRIDKLLGEGGMGGVYLAEDLKHKRKVAIKALFSHLAMQQTVRERFRYEASTMAQLYHPNIVQLLDFIDENGLYLVMEYVEGIELDRYIITQNKHLPWPEAVEMLMQILDALSYAHRRGVIHRDLKPSNLMIDKTGRVKVLDFGVAKILDQTNSPSLTRTGTKIGTILYMSPEQVKGLPVDARADIYSLGVTLFQMLTGRCPYDLALENEFDISLKIVNEPLPRLSAYYTDIPSELQRIIDKATAKSPQNRYQDCYEFAEALHGLQQLYKEVEWQPVTIEPPADNVEDKPFDWNVFWEEKKYYLVSVFILLLAVTFVWLENTTIHKQIFRKHHTETELKARVYDYYKNLETHDFDKVKTFYAPQIEQYFNSNNQNQQQIKDLSERYWEKTPKEDHAIAWETFKAKEDENGNYTVRFTLSYHYRRNGQKKWQVVTAKTQIKLNNDLKIYAITGSN